jgi:hypothetical protein
MFSGCYLPLRMGFLSFLAITLSACGGGGGGNGGFISPPDAGGGGGAVDTPTYTLSMEVLDEAGEESFRLASDESLTVNVTLSSSDGSSTTNEIIQLETSVANIDPSNGSATTDANGVATFELTFNGEEGAGEVTASHTANGTTVETSVNIQAVLVRENYLLTLDTYNPEGLESDTFSALSPLTATVTLTESDGTTPLPDALVALSSTIGEVTPGLGTALTDEMGVASFMISHADEEGAGVIVGNYESDTLSLSAQKNIQAVASSNFYSLSINDLPNNGVITSAAAVEGSVQLSSTDSSQYPIANQIIDLASTIVSISPENQRIRTDEDGAATFVLNYRGVVGAGQLTANFASAQGSTTAVTAIETEIAVAEATPGIVTSLSLSTYTADGVPSRQLSAAQPLTLQVTLNDAFGDVVPSSGLVVDLTSTVANITPPNGSALTDEGVATFGLEFNGEVGGGLVEAQITLDDTTFIGAMAVQAISETPYLISLDRTSGPLSQSNDISVTATLTELDGTAVPNAILNFSSDTAAVLPESAVSDEFGEARTTLKYNGAPGAGSFIARYAVDDEIFSNSFNFDAVEVGPPYQLTILPFTELDEVTVNNELSAETPLLVKVQLLEDSAGLENRVVLLETNPALAKVMPDNGAALTDDTGQATFVLTYGGSTGAGSVVARFDGTEGTVSDDETFEAIVNPVEIGSLDDNGNFIDDTVRVEPSPTVGYLGSVELLFAVGNDMGERVVSTQSIRVESPCLLNGFASLTTSNVIELTDGVGSTTYVAADACADTTDEVTATLIQAGNPSPPSASAVLTLSAAPAADERFITFISAVPNNIALKGSGGGTGLEERAQVTFEVRDGSGNPVAGQEVSFELSRTTGGLTLADALATTDVDGQVAATVVSGTIATPVRVIATTERSPANGVADPISVVSDSLTVSSGIASQARFSLDADILNPAAAADSDGISVTLIATAYDRFGNAVPNGTAMNFTSQCGGVVDAQDSAPTGGCETINGSCQVEWRSQPGAETVCANNRVTVMAHALGEEGFVDADADGYYSSGEDFTDNSEAFRDDDESLSHDANELFIDLNNNGAFDSTTPGPEDALFNGLACNVNGSVCSDELVSVYTNLELVAGPRDASDLTIRVEDSVGTFLTDGIDPMDPGSYVVFVTDAFGNVPPYGTEVRATGSGECEVTSPTTRMASVNAVQALEAGITVVSTGANDPETNDRVSLTIVTPLGVGGSGNAVTLNFACNP